MGLGWGTAVGWLFDRIGDKKQNLRNRIDKIEREMDEIQKKASHAPSDRDRYAILSIKLREAHNQLKNI